MLTFTKGVEATAGFMVLGKSASYKASLSAAVALISATTWGNDPVTGVEAGKALTASLLGLGCDKSEASRKKILGAKVAKALTAFFQDTLADVRDNCPDMRAAVETVSYAIQHTAGHSIEATNDKALEAWADKLCGVKRETVTKTALERIQRAIDKGMEDAELSAADLVTIIGGIMPALPVAGLTALVEAATTAKARQSAIEAALEAKVEAAKVAGADAKARRDAGKLSSDAVPTIAAVA